MGLAPAADGIPIHGDFGGAVELVVRVGYAGIQRGGSRDNLEGAARLVHVGDGGDAHQLRQGIRVVSWRIVGVIVGLHAHGQDAPGAHVGDDAQHTLGLVDLQALPHGLLADLLDGRVHRQAQGVPLLGGNVPALRARQDPVAGIHLPKVAALRASQHVLILLLQTGLAQAVHIRQPQHLAQEIPIRIPSSCVFVKGNGGHSCGRVRFRLQAADFVHGFPGHLSLEDHRALGFVRELLHRALPIQGQHLRQRVQESVRVRHQARIGTHHVGGGAQGQHIAAPVHNGAPPGGDNTFLRPLADAAAGQLVMLEYRQLP